MKKQNITGIDIDFSRLPSDYNSSKHPEAVKYRRALARASNAIEGVVLTEQDRDFIDNIPLNTPKDDFKKAVLNHIFSKRKGGVTRA